MSKKFFAYILRLLAGKFGAICTAFPLATTSAKIWSRTLRISRQKLCKQHLVQKNENWTPIFLSCLKTLKKGWKFRRFFQISTLCTKCCVLNEKALWQATESNKKTKLTEFLSVMSNLLSTCLCVQSDFSVQLAIMLVRNKRSVEQSFSERNTGLNIKNKRFLAKFSTLFVRWNKFAKWSFRNKSE